MDNQPKQPIKPRVVELLAGVHNACTCKKSKDYPLCDGSHQGTEFQPMQFEVATTKKFALCHCGLTSNFPFCDASHKKLKPE